MITGEKFRIIQQCTARDNNVLSISEMCNVAGVSRSGYYNWIACELVRNSREMQDRANFELIKNAFNYRGYAKGARSIHMRLLHEGVLFNEKKIRRLMKKYGLKCPFRNANPYRRMAKALKTSNTFPNVVDRKFSESGPRKILLTDITYLFYTGHVCYLSTIIDACTKEVLAYRVSQSLEVSFVIETVEELCHVHGAEVDNTTIIHSDQGCHYTSYAFIDKLKEEGFIQSMSRRGNCWDNAPQESFFGHMKDEIADTIKGYTEFEQVKDRLDDWIDYYNNERYNPQLKKLSPTEYYAYLTTGVDPLADIQPNRGSAPDPGV